ncbi:MAG: response regulator [Chloroflexi bacterium CFX7]|nr:response regulator [Chloroflexi bacterium CFX7]
MPGHDAPGPELVRRERESAAEEPGELPGAAGLLEAQTNVLAALTPGATFESVAGVVVVQARRLFGASHAVVMDLSGETARVVACSSDHMRVGEIHGRNVATDGNPSLIEAIRDGSAHIIPDLAASAGSLPPIEADALRSGLRCMMRAPIFGSQGEFRGVLSVGSPVPGAFGEAEAERIEGLARVVSVVAERAELLVEASERAEKASGLTHLLGSLSASASPEEAARLFAGQVRALLGAGAVSIHCFDSEAGVRRLVAFDGDADLDFWPESKLLGESRVYRAALENPATLYNANVPGQVGEWAERAAREFGIGSLVAIRLEGSSEPAGILVAIAQQPGTFGESDVQMLAEVATPLAMVLERAVIVASLQRQTQRAAAVVEVLAALGPSDSMEAVAAPLTRALRAMWEADHCLIGLVDGDSVSVAGYDSALDLGWLPRSYPVSALSTTRTAAATGYDVVHDYREELHRSGPMVEGLRRVGLRSSIRVLLGDLQSPVGILTVGSCTPNRFTVKDAQELRRIMQPMAVAAGYYRNLREAQRRNRQLEHTNRILGRLSAASTVLEIASSFLGECRSLFGCGQAALLTIGPETGVARVLGADPSGGFVPAAGSELPLAALGPGPAGCESGIQVMDNLAALEARGALHQQAVEAGLLSVLRVPVAHGEGSCGTVVLWGEGVAAFDDDDSRLLSALTHPLAVALERASALAALAESENKYRSLVTQAEEMIFIVDVASHRVVDANSYTARALGYDPDEMLDLRLDDICLMPEGFVEASIRHIMDEGEIRLSEHEYRRKNGSSITVDIMASRSAYGGRDAVLVLARDVTEIRGFQRQLMQSQKMESLGTMAGAVAHDFNNLLTTILGFAGLLKRSPHLDGEDRENLGLIEDASRHAADLTGRLLAFARGGLVRFGPVDLRDVVNDTLRLAEPALHSKVELAVTLPPDAVMVEGDQGQLQQALINIVLNARDAMPDGGIVTVALQAEQAVATLTVSDNGPGMDEETRTRIFEPFYTTKPPGSGTGLGMAITYGIIQGHHGAISVESGPGRGTSFAITLPLLAAGTVHRSDDSFRAGDGDLIMLVDDDERVRRAVHGMLGEIGFNVVEAHDGATAIQLLKARPERFAAVLLDLVMPGMNGSETFRGLEAIRPDLPVIVCTAYAADAHIDTDVKRRIAGLVQKPFTKDRLERALAGILSR